MEIFLDANFCGTSSGSLDNDSSYVGGFWNDKISSIKIYSGTWEFFEDANYQGRSFRLNPGNYPNLGHDWNDVISSFKQVGERGSLGPSNGGIAERILYLTNEERGRVGSQALSLNPQLMSTAQTHTDLMIRDNQLSHQLPGEPSQGARTSQVGYRWSAIAENIANGYHTPEQVVSGWMQSPGHRANLLEPKYQHLGVGYANSFWTQDFGKSN